ncbi:MAG: TetR/AcrR family transcriptional regulator [Actinobacteria bacterium]|nr:TetR/AcrR family transcriptional regulator [Actinomycetota bacterium]MBO0834186.1 TetR/AcrR family transcriptional regulator [Actinomycetota bacterium]
MRASRRDEYTEATRRALLDSAAAAFTDKGYAATSLEDIARATRLTKGAVYHHFSSKQDLFRAVYDEVWTEFATSLRRAAEDAADPWQRLLAGIRVSLDACLTPRFRRIVLDEAPAALGWQTWRDIESQRAQLLNQPLADLERAGIINPQPLDLMARVVLAMTGEAARAIADAPDPTTARRDAEALLTSLLAGLRTKP